MNASEQNGLEPIANVLSHSMEDFSAAWVDDFATAPMRLHMGLSSQDIRVQVRAVLEELRDALLPGALEAPLAELRPGEGSLKGVERSVAFLGAKLSALGSSGFDVCALFFSLRRSFLGMVSTTKAAEVSSYVDWLMAIALDSMAKAKEEHMREKYLEELERTTPLFIAPGDVPTLCLVGDVGARVLDELLGRLLVVGVQTGSPCVILDSDGCESPDSTLSSCMTRFLSHPRAMTQITLLWVGSEIQQRSLQDNPSIEVFQRMEVAMKRAFDLRGFRLVSKL